MSSRAVNSQAFSSYGISRQRSGFTKIEGSGTLSSEEVVAAGSGMFSILARDMTHNWTMYNGDPVAGNEYHYSNEWNGSGTAGEIITKQFFDQIAMNRPAYQASGIGATSHYTGLANFTEMPSVETGAVDINSVCKQHIMLFETRDDILPNSGAVSRGIPQKYRIRFEFDLRDRLYWYPPTSTGDREFADELYQLNLRLKNKGMPLYKTGSVINDSLFSPSTHHPGYTYSNTLPESGMGNPKTSTGWETQIGIPNPMYGWVKVSVGTHNVLLDNGTVTKPQLTSDGLITLENGSTTDTTILRMPGECVDLHFEDVTLVADPGNVGPYWVYGQHKDFVTYGTSKKYYYPMYLDKVRADQHSAAADPAATATGVITAFVHSNPIKITLDQSHNLVDGQPIRLEGLSNDVSIYNYVENNKIYYAKATGGLQPTEFELFDDSQLVTAVDGTANVVSHDYANNTANVFSGIDDSSIHTFSDFPTATFYMPNHGSATSSNQPNGTVAPYSKYINNRSIKFRNKRRGLGWFKRFPKTSADIAGTYPFSYRLTMTERGLVFYLYDEAAADQADDYAWFCTQRTVNNQTGMPRTDESSKFPVHTLYSCSRESLYSQDFGIYFSAAAANLQNAETQVDTVYDVNGNTYSVGGIEKDQDFYIMSPYDREDYLADEYTAKNIWRFVAREMDVLKPTDVHKYATRHQIDSNAIINPLEQLSITDENRFVITFPTGLTTQRFMYPKEETDLICFSSAEVVAESSNIPMTTYLYDGVITDKRRYQGMRSTAAYGNGMRIMVLVNSQYIFNSDVMMDVNDALGITYNVP